MMMNTTMKLMWRVKCEGDEGWKARVLDNCRQANALCLIKLLKVLQRLHTKSFVNDALSFLLSSTCFEIKNANFSLVVRSLASNISDRAFCVLIKQQQFVCSNHSQGKHKLLISIHAEISTKHTWNFSSFLSFSISLSHSLTHSCPFNNRKRATNCEKGACRVMRHVV